MRMLDVSATQDEALADLAAAERGEGWFAACERAGRYLVVTRGLADALARLLSALGPGPVLEVCAGRGELAAALRERGIDLVTTDAAPPACSAVVRFDAVEALERFQPRTVIGCFVPAGTAVDEAVLGAPSVQQYLVIGARLNGQLGTSRLWSARGWQTEPLPEVTRLLLTRHDVWLGEGRGVLGRGEAWLFRRTDGARDG